MYNKPSILYRLTRSTHRKEQRASETHTHTHAYLNHGSITNEVGTELGNVLREVSNIADERSLETDLRLAQFVRSALGLSGCAMGLRYWFV